ncbi:MAG: nucleotidyltransferase family protein [Acidobacteria bacterium]|nr:nucleotidyltransferase family protein [Acidobacteriota bacterium]
MQYDPIQDEDEVFDEFRWATIYRKAQQKKIADAFRLFHAEGIEPVLFKGWAISRSYPEMVSRISSDIDLAVPSKHFREAERIRTSSAGRKLVIDLHNEFSRHDSLDWATLFARCEQLELDGEPVSIL